MAPAYAVRRKNDPFNRLVSFNRADSTLSRLPTALRGRVSEHSELRPNVPPNLAPFAPIGAIGALMNRVRQPRTLFVLGLNAQMGTTAGADELVEVPTDAFGFCLSIYYSERIDGHLKSETSVDRL